MESIHGTAAGLDVHKKTVVAAVLARDQSEEDHAAAVIGTTRHELNELTAFYSGTWSDACGNGINGSVLAASYGWRSKASSR